MRRNHWIQKLEAEGFSVVVRRGMHHYAESSSGPSELRLSWDVTVERSGRVLTQQWSTGRLTTLCGRIYMSLTDVSHVVYRTGDVNV